jgi:hypothetical protein
MRIRNRSLMTAAVVTACVLSVTVTAVGPAGASQRDILPRTPQTVRPETLVKGTYNWYISALGNGTITFTSGHKWSASVDGEAGSWTDVGRSFGMNMTGGTYGNGGCVFSATEDKAGTAIGSSAKLGNWICPGYGSSGTWYATPVARGTTKSAGGVFRHEVSTARPATIVPGTYDWIFNGEYAGTINFASGNTWSSSLDGDTGDWIDAGRSFVMSITGGGGDGCGGVFVGKENKAGTAVGTSNNPGKWVCPGFNTSGTWFAT